MNQICVTTKPSRDGKKTWYYFEWGKAADQRRAAGIFTYTPAKNQTQRSHNKEAEAILEIKELEELYQIRWGIEEGYKMYKARVQVEAFSGKTATAVKQDIYAKVMMMTLCAALAFPIEERVIAEYNAEKQKGKVKHRRKINRTFAYWSTKCILIGMFIKKKIRSAIAVFDRQIAANTEIVRPGRHHKRKRRPPRLYHMNYKDV